MTTTDPKLIEPVAEIIEAAIERHGCFSLRGTLDDARKIDALYAAAINEAAQKERDLQSAREDSAYFNGAKQAMAMAEQSLDEARKWVVGGCGGRAGSLARAIEAHKESQHGDA